MLFLKMRKTTFLLLLLTISTVAQVTKTIVPTAGAIVFKKIAIINDAEKYKKSYGELSSKMIDFQIKKEISNTIINIDTSKVNQMKKAFKTILLKEIENDITNKENGNLKYHQEFKDNTIINYITSFGEIINNYSIISPKQKLLKILANDSITLVSENQAYSYNQNEIIEIKEHQKENKIIDGYSCFKVVMLYRENLENDIDFENFMQQNYIQKRELWVTTQIKCQYHPIINEKEILLKYYPLEIIESTENIEGFIASYTIESLKIK